MFISEKENTRVGKFSNSWRSLVFRLVIALAVAGIMIPAIPMTMSNLVYSFNGDAPKFYWYLSRASGFVTLSILWVGMALGLGITNKMASLWPGTPTAFALHQYASLLGLVFAVCHGLILMGDHFVDFSLPHLMIPFSIAYETFWVGLGQICFYAWLLVVGSFYIRQFIGQTTWRLIHYINFGTYLMGFLHGLISGTDSHSSWARWYFLFSGTSLVALLAYRIYDSKLKRKILFPQFGYKHVTNTTMTAKAPIPVISRAGKNVYQTPFREQGIKSNRLANLQKEIAALESIKQKTEVKATFASPIVRLQGNYKTKVHVFQEPTTRPIPELQQNIEVLQDEIQAIFERMKHNIGQIHVEPTTPRRHA